MYRKIFVTVMVAMALMILLSGMSSAAPGTLAGDETSTAKLIELYNPEENYSTYNDSCVVSGKSKQGVKVTIYIRKSNGTYEKLKVNNEEVSWVVGPYGKFAYEVELERDSTNHLIIYAEKNYQVQIIKRKVTVNNLALKEVFKNEVVKIENLFSKIIKQ